MTTPTSDLISPSDPTPTRVTPGDREAQALSRAVERLLATTSLMPPGAGAVPSEVAGTEAVTDRLPKSDPALAAGLEASNPTYYFLAAPPEGGPTRGLAKAADEAPASSPVSPSLNSRLGQVLRTRGHKPALTSLPFPDPGAVQPPAVEPAPGMQGEILDPSRLESLAAPMTGGSPPQPLSLGPFEETSTPPLPMASSATSPYYFLRGRDSVTGVSEGFDAHVVRKDFPILDQRVHGKPLIWMDNAATTQKPRVVIDVIRRFYERDNSNTHRGAHTLASRATDAYEAAREKVQRFLGAASPEEIVFVRGATEGINLVAQSWGRGNLSAGDEIVVTALEHHSNIVPWQMLATEKQAVLRVVPINDRGEVMLEEYERLLGPRTRIVALTHVSNALGTVLPVQSMTQAAHRHGARVLVDGAQAVAHMGVNVQDIGSDFYVLSGHKLFGPSGVGVLYGRKELLEQMPPWQGGGNMIRNVTMEESTYAPPPHKFEAGTAIIAGAIGLGAAIDYVNHLGIENIHRYEQGLTDYATGRLLEVPGLRLIGTAREKVSVLSFIIDGTRVEDVGRRLDTHGIAVRAGHHCAQPTMQRYGLTGTVRPSLAFYNTPEEVDRLVDALTRMTSGAA